MHGVQRAVAIQAQHASQVAADVAAQQQVALRGHAEQFRPLHRLQAQYPLQPATRANAVEGVEFALEPGQRRHPPARVER